jgi:hypothetical protein
MLRNGDGWASGVDMDGGAFYRAGQLPDRAGSLPDITSSAEDAPGRRHLTRECHASSLSSLDNRSCTAHADGLLHAPSEEEGLSLLIHGSPIGDTTAGTSDEHLLDYESDSDLSVSQPEKSQREVAQIPPSHSNTVGTDVDMDQPLAGSLGSASSVNGANISLDAMYFQCRSARTAGFKDVLISVSQDDSFGKKLTVPAPSIGSFEDYDGIKDTFIGSRVMKGNATVNQSVSMSFDPSKLNCISCGNEHAVITGNPTVVVFSDQNFVPTLNCKNGGCINIVRLENASLKELVDMASEIFAGKIFPEGSILLFGSASYLSRCGTSIYARDWTELVKGTSSLWRGVRICPLIPLIASGCPGPIVREVREIAVWYQTIYDSDPQGLHEPWMEVVAAMEACSTGATTLEVMESYKIVLPSTLQNSVLDSTVTLCSNNSRPVTFSGIPKDRCCELLGSLLNYLYSNFRACALPEDYLAREDGMENYSEEQKEHKIVLVGASNLGHSVRHFAGADMVFIPVIKPGWVATVENVAELCNIVQGHSTTATLFVFDLFGNSSVRFEQFDGTTSLPFRSNGKYHLGGKVVVTPPEIFRRVVENVLPVLKAKGSKPCLILPPLPRYLFAGCCSDRGHCSNMHKKGYQEEIMGGFIQLRANLIRLLVSSGLTNFKVMDSCCATNCPLTASVSERIGELRKVTSKDGVHFIDDGYRNIAERCTRCISATLSDDCKPTCSRKPTVHFWRGFRSPKGSLMPKLENNFHNPHQGHAARGSSSGSSRGHYGGHGRSRPYHPYRKW